MTTPINILVVGECGDGKSTLINGMRDKDQTQEPLCGRNPEGVTKDIILYRCPDIDGVPFNLIDTPGVGDGTVTPVALIALIEQFLQSDCVPGGIRGVIVTTPIPDCRIKLGAQVVQIIVNKGFVASAGADKYGNIMLVGTKADKADDEEKENFLTGVCGDKSVREIFFKDAQNPGQGPCCMVSKGDYSPLIDTIKKLPCLTISYKAPDTKEMAGALAEKMGMDASAFEGQLDSMRDLVSQQSNQIKELMMQMHQSNETHRAEMAARDEKMMQLQKEMMEDRRRAEELRMQREQEFEKMRQEEKQAARAERDQQQKQWASQLEAQQKARDTMMQQMQKEATAAQARHAEDMKKMQAASQQQFKAALEANKPQESGGDCFPGSATVETPNGRKSMVELRAGDRVLAADASGKLFFDEVYFFGHAHADELGPIVLLRTASGRGLRSSPKHLVPVVPRSEKAANSSLNAAVYRYAGNVKAGDKVWVRGGAGRAELEDVLEVVACADKGLFNPFTLSGTVVVDGVVASVHSEWLLDDFMPASRTSHLHGIYQKLLLPGRGLYRLLGAAAADILGVNNPQPEWNKSVKTSRRAFAFFVTSHLLPLAVVSTALVQRLAHS